MTSSILKDNVICLSGTFPSHKHNDLKDMIKQHGGTFSLRVLDSCTHLITTKEDINSGSTKYKQSLKFSNIKLVSLDWLLDSAKAQKRLDESSYLLTPSSGASTTAPAAPTPAAPTRVTRSKRALNSQVDEDKDITTNDEPPPKKKKLKEDSKSSTAEKNGEAVEDTEDKAKPIAPKIKVPVNASHLANQGYQVYIDDNGVIYDAALNQTNAGHNNNKFYTIQLLVKDSTYTAWAQWGRVGERGEGWVLATGDFDTAHRAFLKRFRKKSGLSWENRNGKPKPGQYTYIERNYEEDDGEEESKKMNKKKEDGALAEAEVKMPECTLPQPVQRVVGYIFNQQYWMSTMEAMDYDANKLPLGKLSKRTLQTGFQILKELSELVNDKDLFLERNGGTFYSWAERLSNQYLTVIPHAFGRRRPPILSTVPQIKREIELLETLTDMEIANEIMLDAKAVEHKIHPLDRLYQALNLREMTPLDATSTEYVELKNYLEKTRGHTHFLKYKLQHIFRVERQGENDRFLNSPYANIKNSNRRLLWHGSRMTNYGGILSQGLRIAPPEAPVSGYMFGKGVYFADMSSKSANYCHSSCSNRLGLLMLCDVELGDPMLELKNAEYDAGKHAKEEGKLATLGMGQKVPSGWKDAGCVHPDLKGVLMPDTSTPPKDSSVDGLYLQYNEYIVYDVAQIRIKYLFLVHMFE
ncbi:hypothetical protein VTO42DRAFT_7517 [Malbranchea cinnamomea]